MANFQIVILMPNVAPYSVRDLDALYEKFGPRLSVLTLRKQVSEIAREGQSMGKFPTIYVTGKYIALSRAYVLGKRQPFGMLLTPTLPLILFRTKPDVVLSPGFNFWSLTSLVCGFPTIILSDYARRTQEHTGKLRIAVRRWMARRAKAFVVQGHDSYHYLTENLNVPPGKISVGYRSAPEIRDVNSKLRPRRWEPGTPLKFLFVGQLIPRKGVEALVEAFAMLPLSGPDSRNCRLSIAGEGSQSGFLKELAVSLGVDGYVDFVGHVPQESIWQLYRESHVFVMPTLHDDGPMVVTEAMALGMPVLLSERAGWCEDLIHDGKNGHLIDPSNIGQICRQMQNYLITPSDVERHGARSIEIISTYTADRVATALSAAIEQVLSEKK